MLKLINEDEDNVTASDGMRAFYLEKKNTLVHRVLEVYYYIDSEGKKVMDNDAASVYTRTFKPLSDFIK